MSIFRMSPIDFAPFHRQCFLVETRAAADVAAHLHVGQKAHFDRPHALAVAALAAPACGVE
jgi:hypothetical protein